MIKKSLHASTLSRIIVLCTVILTQNYIHIEFEAPLIVLTAFTIMFMGKIQQNYIKLVWPLIVLTNLGLFGIYGHEVRDILRDIAFSLMPIALIYLGHWIGRDKAMWPLLLKVIVYISLILAAIHLFGYIQHPELLSDNVDDIRKEFGTTGDLILLSLIIGLFQKKFGIHNIFPKLLPRAFYIVTLLTSYILSFSRTEFLAGLIFLLAMLGLLSKINRRFFLAIAICITSYATLVFITPANEVDTFRSKILRSVEEITISNYTDMSDITQHWRGYETQQAIETYLSGNSLQLIFGQGFGALIDLNVNMALGSSRDIENMDANLYSYVPITHNGYAYLLVKTGVCGLVCYILFFIKIIKPSIKYSYSNNKVQSFIARLLLGTIFSLIATMYVVGGMAQGHNIEYILLIGYLIKCIEKFKTQNNIITIKVKN